MTMYTEQRCTGTMRKDSKGDLVCSNSGCGRRIKENGKEYDKRLIGTFCSKIILVKVTAEVVIKESSAANKRTRFATV